MIVLNVDLIIYLIQRVVFVLKFVVMERNIHLAVMMEIILMVMDAARIVMLRLDTHVMVDHQALKIPVQQFSHQ